MDYWEKVAQRLSVPGLVLLTAGVALCFGAGKLCRLVGKEKGEKWVLPVKITGLALVIFAALILLDFIPGL